MKKIIGILAAVGLLATILTAQASAADRCNPYRVKKPPETDATNRVDALSAEVIEVTEDATWDDPVTVTYEHGAGMVFPLHQHRPLINDAEYFNFQVDTQAPLSRLNVRIDWPAPSMSDIDLYAYNGFGTQIGYSESFNTPAEEALDPSAGPGFESMQFGQWTDCRGLTVESQGSHTQGEQMTLSVWLGATGHESRIEHRESLSH